MATTFTEPATRGELDSAVQCLRNGIDGLDARHDIERRSRWDAESTLRSEATTQFLFTTGLFFVLSLLLTVGLVIPSKRTTRELERQVVDQQEQLDELTAADRR